MLCNDVRQEGEIIDRREFKNEREEWEKFVEGIPRDDVLLRQLESVDKEVEFVQKQIAGKAIRFLYC